MSGSNHGTSHGNVPDELPLVDDEEPIQAAVRRPLVPGSHYEANEGYGTPEISRELIPPPPDVMEHDIWQGYEPQAGQANGLGLDCPIRAAPPGHGRCGWRPKDRAKGLPNMTRVKYVTLFRSLYHRHFADLSPGNTSLITD